MHAIFMHGFLPNSFVTSLIAPISKKYVPSCTNDRPISFKFSVFGRIWSVCCLL